MERFSPHPTSPGVIHRAGFRMNKKAAFYVGGFLLQVGGEIPGRHGCVQLWREKVSTHQPLSPRSSGSNPLRADNGAMSRCARLTSAVSAPPPTRGSG